MRPHEIIEFKLHPAVKECQLHKRRLEYALGQLSGEFPLNAEKWQSLDDETVADIDQLLFRYNKLQDAPPRLDPCALLLDPSVYNEMTKRPKDKTTKIPPSLRPNNGTKCVRSATG